MPKRQSFDIVYRYGFEDPLGGLELVTTRKEGQRRIAKYKAAGSKTGKIRKLAKPEVSRFSITKNGFGIRRLTA